MFDAIANPRSSGRHARSVAFSLTAHFAVVGTAVVLAIVQAREKPAQIVDVPVAPYRPNRPPKDPSGNRPMTRPDREKPRRPARPMIEPKEIPQSVEPPPQAMEAPTDPPSAGVPATEPDNGTGSVIPGIPGGLGNGPTESPSVTAGPPPEFDDSMTPPRMISGPEPRYTQEALEREIQGTMVVKCVVTTQGIVRNCRVLKSLPFMDRAVIEALEKRRYTAALLRSQPIEVDYTFTLQLKLPQ